jgi:beta-glucan synthesis-associated protein KRE6
VSVNPIIQKLSNPILLRIGNLGRAGFGASLDEMWPYSYDSCDRGTLPNQSHNGLPEATTTTCDKYNEDKLSSLVGPRLSACVCADETTHPGPNKSDGTWRDRSAPELDIVEAIILDGEKGEGIGQLP